jgi:hypothetical protein
MDPTVCSLVHFFSFLSGEVADYFNQIFFLLKDAVDQCWEVKMTKFSKAIKYSPPVPGLARGLFFLLEATCTKFEALKELATIARLHERQKLLSRKMQEEIWYDKWVTEQEALHEATIANIEEDL